MSDFWLYFKLGFEHVLDWQAYDHVLFLIVLSAAFTFNSWKRLLILVTMFTMGHTASLFLANFDIVSVSSKYIEFLIPITILVAALFNLFTARRVKTKENLGVMYVVTIFFGLIHGFGFASFFKRLNDESEIMPLIEFALGIEIAQLIVVLLVLVIATVFQSIMRINKRDWIMIVSSIVIGLTIPMIVEHWIF